MIKDEQVYIIIIIYMYRYMHYYIPFRFMFGQVKQLKPGPNFSYIKVSEKLSAVRL